MKFSRIFLLMTVGYLTLITSLHAQNISYTKALLTKLFTTDGYDKRVRPEQDMVDITGVTVSLLLNSIIELDEVEEKLVTTASLYLDWYDSNLVWDTADYGGTDILFLPQGDIWKPDVVLLNSVNDYKELGGANLQVTVEYDGLVSWYPIQKFESACSINIRYFPYDIQRCSLKFGAWSYTKSEIILSGGSRGIDLGDYSENSAWVIVDSSWNVEWDSGEASISFNMHLKRKPLFVLFTTIVPIVMLSVLNILVFVLPNESGEKSGYAVTVFLALAVFLTIISSTLPENSDSISIFSIYVTAQTVQSTLITGITLLMIRLSALADQNLIPKWLVKLTLFFRRLRSRKNRVRDSQTNLVSGQKKVEVTKVEDISETMTESTSPESSVQDEVSWKEAMNVLDLLAIIFFTISSFVITLVCMLMARYG